MSDIQTIITCGGDLQTIISCPMGDSQTNNIFQTILQRINGITPFGVSGGAGKFNFNWLFIPLGIILFLILFLLFKKKHKKE